MVLQLDPLYDVDFSCPTCGKSGFRGPGPLEEHMETHMVSPNAVDAVPVNAVAGPLTPGVVPVKRKRGRPPKKRD